MTSPRARPKKLPPVLRTLTAIDLFVGLTALVGGIALIADPSGELAGLPLALLERSPFSTFLIPGVLLAAAVGGVALLAGIAHMARWRLAGQLSLIAGVVLLTWLVIQVVLIGAVAWLHLLYGAAGLAQIALVFIALGRATSR